MTMPSNNQPEQGWLEEILQQVWANGANLDLPNMGLAEAKAAIEAGYNQKFDEVNSPEWPHPWSDNQRYLATNDLAIKAREELRSWQHQIWYNQRQLYT